MNNMMTDEDQADLTSEQESAQDGTQERSSRNTEEFSDGSLEDEPPIPRAAIDAKHKMKWKRLKKHYNDQYLDLFNSTHEDALSKADPEYPDGQIGAVVWSSKEKRLFFSALDRFGLRDLPRIARAVKTKSRIEVRGYIDCLHKAHVDSHLYEKQTKNVSQSDIPAAVEIGEGCEQALNEAADALAAFQEQYDVQAGLMQHGPEWIIDRAVAARLDATADQIEQSSEEEEEDASGENPSTHRHQILRLGKMLALSEELFMNKPAESVHDHWQLLAEKGQRPALTQDVVDDIYGLIVGQTQRILQTAIIIAKAQLGTRGARKSLPAAVLTSRNIRAALDVLKMPHHAGNFWTCFPRRSGLQVVSGSRSSKPSQAVAMSYEEVEAILSAREFRGRKRFRSVSIDRSSSEVRDANSGSDQENSEGIEAPDIMDYESQNQADDPSTSELDESGESPSETSSENGTTRATRAQTRSSQAKKRRILEDAQEEYMERQDQQTRRHEEAEIWQLLGREPGSSVEHEEEQLGIRPRSLRKTEQELRGWKCTYVPEWERFGKLVPEQEFVATARSKKRKVEAGVQN